MDKHQTDILILVETWLEEQLKLEGSEYEIIQTESHKSRGVAIIYRNVKIKKEIEQFNDILVCSIRDKNRVKAYIIGVYRENKLKQIIEEKVNQILKRIRRKHPRAKIILYSDLNIKNEKELINIQEKWQ